MWVPKLLLTPKKLGFLAHKQPNLADQKRCKQGFFNNVGTKTFASYSPPEQMIQQQNNDLKRS